MGYLSFPYNYIPWIRAGNRAQARQRRFEHRLSFGIAASGDAENKITLRFVANVRLDAAESREAFREGQDQSADACADDVAAGRREAGVPGNGHLRDTVVPGAENRDREDGLPGGRSGGFLRD